MTALSCPMTTLVDRHFAARIRPEAERDLREHLPDCSPCRTRYDRRLILHQVDPRGRKAEARLAVGLGLRPGSRRVPILAALSVTSVAVAAAILLFVLKPSSQAGFTPRGPSDTELWVFEMQGEEATPLRERISPDAELAFAYKNGESKQFLMVFGVDEAARVYWYHPAWTRQADNPTAVRIQPGGVHELPAAVRHPLAGPTLEIHAVFTDEALSVRDIEDRVAKWRGTLDIPGSIERTLKVEVRR